MSNINFFRVLQSGGFTNPAPPGTVRTVLFIAALTETVGTWSNITSSSVPSIPDVNSWDPCSDPATNGLPNSNAIIAQSGHTNSAAKYCLDFSSGGYSDWYLGTTTEVSWMADIYEDTTLQNIITNAGGTALGSGNYWSSREASSTTAYATDGSTTSNIQKYTSYSIRPQKTIVLDPTGQYTVGNLAFGGIIFQIYQLTYGNIC